MVEKEKINITPKNIIPDKKDKYLVFHIQGGLGKHIAATSLLKDLSLKYSDRKIILVVGYPEIFLNNPYVYRVYVHNSTPYFYDDYVKDKDTIVFMHEPYYQSGHISKQKHLIENWCDLLDLKYTRQTPEIYVNYSQRKFTNMWVRPKPIMVIQTNGGPLDAPNAYSWTRDIPYEVSLDLANNFSQLYHIIQICTPNSEKLPNVEVVDYKLTNLELIALLINSEKRVLIDSALQHAAAAFNLPSTVLWVGTSPKVFGYNMHANIEAKLPTEHSKLIDSYLFDYSFEGKHYECPFIEGVDIFDRGKVYRSLN